MCLSCTLLKVLFLQSSNSNPHIPSVAVAVVLWICLPLQQLWMQHFPQSLAVVLCFNSGLEERGSLDYGMQNSRIWKTDEMGEFPGKSSSLINIPLYFSATCISRPILLPNVGFFNAQPCYTGGKGGKYMTYLFRNLHSYSERRGRKLSNCKDIAPEE